MSSLWDGERVRLRAIEPRDAADLQDFDRDSDGQRSSWQVHPPAGAGWYADWTANLGRGLGRDGNPPPPDVHQLAIARLTDDRIVGSLSTNAPDRKNGCFMYGIGLGPEHRRSGYAGEALRLLLRFMFDESGFRRVEAGVFGFNDASLAFHRRFGFTEEGRLRQKIWAQGRWWDEHRFGLLAAEFRERYPTG